MKKNTKIALILLLVIPYLLSKSCYFLRDDFILYSNINFTNDGQTLLLSINAPYRERGQLHFFDFKNESTKRLTKNRNENKLNFDLSKDNQWIVHEVTHPTGFDEPNKIMLYNTKSKQQIPIIENSFFNQSPSLSKDNKTLVFSRAISTYQQHMSFGQIWGGYDVYIKDLDTQQETQMTDKSYYRAITPRLVDNYIYFIADDSKETNSNRILAKISIQTKEIEYYPNIELSFFEVTDKNEIIINQSHYNDNQYSTKFSKFKNGQLTELFQIKNHRIGSFSISNDFKKLAWVENNNIPHNTDPEHVFIYDISSKKLDQWRFERTFPRRIKITKIQ